MPESDTLNTVLLVLSLIAFVVAGFEAGRRKPPAWWNLLVASGLALFVLSLLL